MKKISFALLLGFGLVILTACNNKIEEEIPNTLVQESTAVNTILPEYEYFSEEEETIHIPDSSNVSMGIAEYEYFTFEETVLQFVTHFVIARYIESRPFGNYHTEFEFEVVDEILGQTSERIFVFLQHTREWHPSNSIHYGDLSFETGVAYLLPLIHTDSVHSIVERDGNRFIFISRIVIDLDNPSNSTMYGKSLDDHIDGIDLDEETAAEEIIAFVEELAEEIEDRRERIIIDSDDIEEILVGSPRVWIVEISEPIRLAHEQAVKIWVSNDLYYTNIIEILKGDGDVNVNVNDVRGVVFPPGRVFTGERHIIAIVNNFPEGSFYDLTSRYALFSMDQLEEIREILANNE